MVVFPLWARLDKPAKRIIVQARVGGRGPDIMHPGLCLLDADGNDSAQARAVLRDGAALDMSS